jgi:uncharacterized protein (DUF952 family)
MRETFHVVPEATWTAADPGMGYEPASLETEGFIHCTDGVAALGETFDRHYATDLGPFLALTIDLDALDVSWRYDDPDSPYPHVYGPVARSAIVAVNRVERGGDGRFEGLAPA